MTSLYFAYASNMSRAVMRKHAPGAEPVGTAQLSNYRFVITADGYASVEPRRGKIVHGVLWRLTARDRVMLDAWENVAGGRYCAQTLPVSRAGHRLPALVYIARSPPAGGPKAGYMQIVLEAAREWKLPEPYVATLRQWLPSRPIGASVRKLGEFGWI